MSNVLAPAYRLMELNELFKQTQVINTTVVEKNFSSINDLVDFLSGDSGSYHLCSDYAGNSYTKVRNKIINTFRHKLCSGHIENNNDFKKAKKEFLKDYNGHSILEEILNGIEFKDIEIPEEEIGTKTYAQESIEGEMLVLTAYANECMEGLELPMAESLQGFSSEFGRMLDELDKTLGTIENILNSEFRGKKESLLNLNKSYYRKVIKPYTIYTAIEALRDLIFSLKEEERVSASELLIVHKKYKDTMKEAKSCLEEFRVLSIFAPGMVKRLKKLYKEEIRENKEIGLMTKALTKAVEDYEQDENSQTAELLLKVLEEARLVVYNDNTESGKKLKTLVDELREEENRIRFVCIQKEYERYKQGDGDSNKMHQFYIEALRIRTGLTDHFYKNDPYFSEQLEIFLDRIKKQNPEIAKQAFESFYDFIYQVFSGEHVAINDGTSVDTLRVVMKELKDMDTSQEEGMNGGLKKVYLSLKSSFVLFLLKSTILDMKYFSDEEQVVTKTNEATTAELLIDDLVSNFLNEFTEQDMREYEDLINELKEAMKNTELELPRLEKALSEMNRERRAEINLR